MNDADRYAVKLKALIARLGQPVEGITYYVIQIGPDIMATLRANPAPCTPPDLDSERGTFCGIRFVEIEHQNGCFEVVLKVNLHMI